MKLENLAPIASPETIIAVTATGNLPLFQYLHGFVP
jgi:hypothetical protein